MRTLSCNMWDLVPGAGIEPGGGPLRWEGGALATGPPGKSPLQQFKLGPLLRHSMGTLLSRALFTTGATVA